MKDIPRVVLWGCMAGGVVFILNLTECEVLALPVLLVDFRHLSVLGHPVSLPSLCMQRCVAPMICLLQALGVVWDDYFVSDVPEEMKRDGN